jgi:hypothetical protein
MGLEGRLEVWKVGRLAKAASNLPYFRTVTDFESQNSLGFIVLTGNPKIPIFI